MLKTSKDRIQAESIKENIHKNHNKKKKQKLDEKEEIQISKKLQNQVKKRIKDKNIYMNQKQKNHLKHQK